jgi:hypothetical protein
MNRVLERPVSLHVEIETIFFRASSQHDERARHGRMTRPVTPE